MWRRESRQFVVTVSVLMLTAVAVPAQDKPDFSGRWRLIDPDTASADVPRSLAVQQSLVRTNARGEPMTPYFKDITISREYAGGSRTETYPLGVVGGVVPGVRPDGTQAGPSAHHATRWQSDTLVFENGLYARAESGARTWSERSESWTLEPDGRLRVTIITRSSVDASRTLTLLYQRR